MKHHEWVAALRRRGHKPACVWLHVDGDAETFAEVNRLPNSAPQVVIEPADAIDRLDLRWLVGCMVFVHGESEARVRRAFARAQDEGAARVIAYAPTCVLDTAGILTEQSEYAHG